MAFDYFIALDGNGLNGFEGFAGVARLRCDPAANRWDVDVKYFDGLAGGHALQIAPDGKLGFLGNLSQTILLFDPRTMKEVSRLSTLRFVAPKVFYSSQTHVVWTGPRRFITVLGPDFWEFDVDDLEKVVAQNLGARQGDVSRAEAIVDEELRRFGEWQRSLGVVPTITALRERFLGVARAEVERVLPGLGGLSEKDARTLRQLADAIANKLLHQPLTQLKKEAGAAGPEADAAVELVRKLFALSDDTTAQPAAETPGAGQPDDKATRSKQGAGGGK